MRSQNQATRRSGGKALGKRTPRPRLAYRTRGGALFAGPAEVALTSPLMKRYRRKIRLIFTSPPLPPNRKKKHGNPDGLAYVDWAAAFAPIIRDFLARDRSVVIAVG